MSWDIRTATEAWLISLIQRVEGDGGRIGGYDAGDRVVKLSDRIAVKYGYGVTPSEAATQEFAYQHVDRNILRVPCVHRFFQDFSNPRRTKGYLFMEFIPGKLLKDVDLNTHDDIVQRIAGIIVHLGSILGDQIPGPLGGGQPQGYLWGDNGAKTTFYSVADMNGWLNKRLALHKESVDLTPYPLVLCHMDLCRRNMIFGEDNKSIFFLDWGHAGFYPRFFEITAISCMNPHDKPYGKPLLEATKSLLQPTEEETRLLNLMHRARAINLRYLLIGIGMYTRLPLCFVYTGPISQMEARLWSLFL